ncbi:hypothetical protein TNCT_444321 [Trichonephila clavata]|uniref:Uncharacterized protein n=1 Tax=Trichonephila clavata TaxID=2740835 RepID=A0A8X6GTV8_TRICU|nr:hypothetical protein TNCT_444321 [Trichonephila clavata]
MLCMCRPDTNVKVHDFIGKPKVKVLCMCRPDTKCESARFYWKTQSESVMGCGSRVDKIRTEAILSICLPSRASSLAILASSLLSSFVSALILRLLYRILECIFYWKNTCIVIS